MEFPYGHHHRRDPDENERLPPYYSPQPAPPSSFGQPPPPRSPYDQETEYSAPPPETRPYSHVSHVHHASNQGPGGFGSVYHHQPAAVGSEAVHVGHVSHGTTLHQHRSFETAMPAFPHHHSAASAPALSGKRTVRCYCKAAPDFSLAIRNGKVILARSDPSDQFQHWYKDEKFSTRVKDKDGHPSFALVNKATGQAMKHSIGATQPVELIPYNPDVLDASVLWTESRETGEGYRAIRMVNNIHLNVDAFHGDKNSGGVHDGTTIVLWEWLNGENQRWKLVPYCKFFSRKTQ